MNLKGIEDHVVLIDSMSKRFSACGIRVGALVSHNKDVISTALKFGQQRLCPPVLGQLAAEAALDSTDEYYDSVQQEYTRRRDFLVEALNQMPGVLCPKPRGAFYVIARLPVDDSEKFAQWLLSDFNFQNQTVMVAPASGFYSTDGLGKNEVRLAYVLNVDDFKGLSAGTIGLSPGGANGVERFNELIYANITYDLNAAVRVAAEYENQDTQYGNNSAGSSGTAPRSPGRA